MISTGNDIVDLNAIDRQRTIKARFYSKILSLSEEALYRRQEFAGMPLEHFVWLVWSVKESVYKYCRRFEPDLIFSPLKMMVAELEEWDGGGVNGEIAGMEIPGTRVYRGIVRSAFGIFFSRSILHAGYISTIAGEEENFPQVCWGAAYIDRAGYAEQSASVRRLLLDKLHALLPADEGSLRLDKNPAGCPVVYRNEEETEIAVSLSHHGHFIAYSLLWRG